ncbi:ABC transporter substrate-binding protein [Cohnella hongkongensis]|uniref:ABC transporter substrate-binding protein n=1 Tax=Cohnella hongkongensis TaxID=178337 RepID=A0ABV9FG11_9BACL
MFRKITALAMACALVFSLVSVAGAASAANTKTREITYKGQVYTVPVKTNKIVIVGALEAMEDALVLNFKPLGAPTTGGEFPALYSRITKGVQGIGEKTQPNLEKILKLKPDVILTSTKFPAETNEKLGKIAVTIPVSHISTDWVNNLKLLGDLIGNKKAATQAVLQYQRELALVKKTLAPKLENKTVMAVRIRAGNLFIYPKDVFFNPSLYRDLGASVPKEVAAAKAQQNISLEKFAEINPDYLFLQFSPEENADQPKALEELQKNPIWKSLKAVKNGHVYVNTVDPLAQGGTAYSKISFLQALKQTKLYKGK